MNSPEKRIKSSSLIKYTNIPRLAKLINTVIAVILFGLGIYHYTQPNEAWRSGTTEVIAAMMLLIAGYRISRVKATIVNLVVAVVISIAGIRHLIHGGGWKSGITELVFTILLIAAASLIFRNRVK